MSVNPSANPPEKDHLIAIDGLRGVAALGVTILHAGLWTGAQALPHGYLAVDFFLMLSGFVLSLAYRDRLRSDMRFPRFAALRIIRLYPMRALAAALGALANLYGSRPDYGNLAGAKLLLATVSAALCIPVHGLGGIEPFPVNNPEWSLFFELFVSVAFGLILFRLSLRPLVIVAVALAVPHLWVARARGMNVGWTWEGFGYGFLRVSLPFVIGMVVHQTWRAGRLPRRTAPFAVLAGLLIGYFAIPPLPRADWIVTVAFVSIAAPVILIAAINLRPGAATTRIARLSAAAS